MKVYGQDIEGKPIQFRKVIVILGVHSSGKTFRLKFYENETIDGDEYYILLRYTCIPQLKNLNQPPGNLYPIIWQRDGAKVHRTRKVLSYLEGQVGNRIIGMDSYQGHNWPVGHRTLIC